MGYKIGTNEVAQVRIGTTPVTKIHRGSERVWPEFAASEVALTRLAEWDFEKMNVGSGYTIMSDSSGNNKTLTPNGAASFAIVQDGVRRGLQLTGTGLLSLRRVTDTAFAKQFHDGTKNYTIYIECKIDDAENPNAIRGILGTSNAGNTRTGFSFLWDDRVIIGTVTRNNHLRFFVNNSSGTAPQPFDTGFDCSVRANRVASISARVNMSGGAANVYADGSLQFEAAKSAQAFVTTNATYDFEIGASGNAALPFKGVIYRIVIYEGLITDADRIKLEASRVNGITKRIDRRVKDIITDSRYNAFGTLFTVSATKKMYVVRSGTSHTTEGRIDLIDYDTTTKVWSNRRTIFAYANGQDCRDPRGGVINGKIYIWFVRRDRNAGANLDKDVANSHGYMRSTDLTGTSWEPFVSFPTTYSYTTPWGKVIVNPANPLEAYISFWELERFDTSGGQYIIGIRKTIDGGNTWTKHIIYQGTEQCTETTIAYLGNNKLIAIARQEIFFGNVGGLAHFYSSDGGVSWSSFTRTSMGSNVINIPALWYDQVNDTITLIYQDRNNGTLPYNQTNGNGYLMISAHNPVNTVFANPAAWKTPSYYHNNNLNLSHHKGLGYPDLDGELAVWAEEVSGQTVSKIVGREENLKGIN